MADDPKPEKKPIVGPVLVSATVTFWDEGRQDEPEFDRYREEEINLPLPSAPPKPVGEFEGGGRWIWQGPPPRTQIDLGDGYALRVEIVRTSEAAPAPVDPQVARYVEPPDEGPAPVSPSLSPYPGPSEFVPANLSLPSEPAEAELEESVPEPEPAPEPAGFPKDLVAEIRRLGFVPYESPGSGKSGFKVRTGSGRTATIFLSSVGAFKGPVAYLSRENGRGYERSVPLSSTKDLSLFIEQVDPRTSVEPARHFEPPLVVKAEPAPVEEKRSRPLPEEFPKIDRAGSAAISLTRFLTAMNDYCHGRSIDEILEETGFRNPVLARNLLCAMVRRLRGDPTVRKDPAAVQRWHGMKPVEQSDFVMSVLSGRS